MLKKLTLSAALIGSIACPAYAENVKGDLAVVRALDKVTATTKDYNVAVGDTLTYGSLKIKIHHCEKKPPEETPETFVFLEVLEPSKANEEKEEQVNETGEVIDPTKLFSGWMFASSPALSALEHPVYDIWVLDCLQSGG
ncbi:MAG: DUF2155 domain-containing protein [Acidimicrobiales bacterium]|nr:DUF2155 domain-containing protein [Hyphomonadaceae bacterium]RZV34284.1 MAG: DUF2155 domain-containing protein [Acidimicrobiales bacterium]